jgi:hypothetical protein
MIEKKERHRFCSGGLDTPIPICGKPATVVVSRVEEGASAPLCWFACDNPEHHSGGTTEPIGDWFARNVDQVGS